MAGSHHELEMIPQSIADGWQGKCPCGWKTFVSFYDFQERDDLIAELQKQFAEHIAKGK